MLYPFFQIDNKVKIMRKCHEHDSTPSNTYQGFKSCHEALTTCMNMSPSGILIHSYILMSESKWIVLGMTSVGQCCTSLVSLLLSSTLGQGFLLLDVYLKYFWDFSKSQMRKLIFSPPNNILCIEFKKSCIISLYH